MTTKRTAAKATARKGAATTKAPKAMTTTQEIDEALARLAKAPGKTQHFHVDLAGTTLNAVRVRILRTPRRHGWAANRIRLVATEGTVVTLQVTNTGEAATPLPESAGGPAPVPAPAPKARRTRKAAKAS